MVMVVHNIVLGLLRTSIHIYCYAEGQVTQLTMFLKKLLPFNTSNKYTPECRLSGHHDAILCLAVSNSGKMLASGGIKRLHSPMPKEY